ncbi:T9SS type A sorting domain-containing protein [Flavihumibacter rivuli]|uniref:T9SS type A sorting domain-containing protein n=1 Tax=Flavihumibacter rivuli TaxID=2838156 RepID=UPI001BDEABCC|nr:T9SS type A sorting domain-containing protein [Flavihumibacter rivuli]ULQ57306.1 T9SS type A sorting domain-containing protein [Flavihumibacter rivuli]
MIFRNRKKWLLAFTVGVLAVTGANAQDGSSGTVNVTGGSATNDKFSLEWSIGELTLIDTRMSPNKAFMVTQGLLQPSFVPALVMVRDPGFAKDEIRILPNPVRSQLQIQCLVQQLGKMKYMLYTENGQRMLQNSFNYYGYGTMHTINMTKLAAGTYMLYLELEPIEGSVVRKGVFKIIKVD